MAAHIPRGPNPNEQRRHEVLAALVYDVAFGRLIAFPKKPSGTRPIANGETPAKDGCEMPPLLTSWLGISREIFFVQFTLKTE